MGTPPQPPPPPPPPPPPQWGAQFPREPGDPGPQGTVDPSQITPRPFWYWIAGAIALACTILAILVFASGGGDDDGDGDSLLGVFGTLQELQPPGEVTADLEAGDEWAIYRLTHDSGGTRVRGGDVSCDVTGPDRRPVPLNTDLGFGTLTLNGEQYVTEYTFDATQSGSYTVECLVAGGPSVPLQVGQEVSFEEVFGFFGDIFGGVGRVLVGILLLILGLLVGGGIALGVWLSRSRKLAEARRRGALQ